MARQHCSGISGSIQPESPAALAGMRNHAYPSLSLPTISDIPVRIPSLSEQQRIAAILDEAFEGIAIATANAEAGLKTAKNLFDSVLHQQFSTRDMQWQATGVPLSRLCELIVDCEHKTAPSADEGIPSIRTPNIGKGRLKLDNVNRVSEQTYKLWTRRAEPAAGDLILAREAPAGNVAVVPTNLRVCLGQRTVLIRPRRDIFESEFLALLLLQPRMQRALLAHSKGATVQHVNLKDIRALDVGRVPRISIQKEFVTRFWAVADSADRLQSILMQKLAALDDLKKSLLHDAFSGQL